MLVTKDVANIIMSPTLVESYRFLSFQFLMILVNGCDGGRYSCDCECDCVWYQFQFLLQLIVCCLQVAPKDVQLSFSFHFEDEMHYMLECS